MLRIDNSRELISGQILINMTPQLNLTQFYKHYCRFNKVVTFFSHEVAYNNNATWCCESTEVNVAIGTVKWFNNAKGYGFIEPQEGGEDIFVHYSTITMDGYKSLKAGQAVSFKLSDGPKGVHATEIKPDSETTDSPE